MAKNCGEEFEKLVQAILDDEAFAVEALGADDAKRNGRLQKYLGKAKKAPKARAKLKELVSDTDYLDKIRLLASLLEPDHPSSVIPKDDAPI